MDMNNATLRSAAAGLLCVGLLPPLWAGDPVAPVQQAAAEWARVRAETVRLESDWTWQRTLIQGTLDALQERARQLEAKRAGLEARTAEEQREVGELTAGGLAMKEAGAEATRRLQELGERLVRMRAWLPPRLSAALDLSYRSLAAQDASPGERMRHAMAILNRCTHFNRTIVAGEEMVAGPGAEARLMEVVYWGLGNGYALDRAASAAYAGSPTESGWAWVPAPDLAAQVARLLATSRDQAEPEFVAAPAQASDPAVLNPQP